jgi:glutamine amidotransferase
VIKLPLKLGNKGKLPHVSWNEILPPSHDRWNHTILESTAPSSDVYFIHSYVALPDNPNDVLAYTSYGDGHFCSAVQRDNITGFQFHPEKSGKIGLKMLSEFIKSTRKINYESI